MQWTARPYDRNDHYMITINILQTGVGRCETQLRRFNLE